VFPDINPVIQVRGVPKNALVLLVEGVHRAPGERDAIDQQFGEVRKLDVLPCRVLDAPVFIRNGKPGRSAKITVLGQALCTCHCALGNVAQGKVGNGIAARLVEDYDVLAVGDPRVVEFDPHAPPQSLREEQPLWKRSGGKETADRMAGQRTLLPPKTHQTLP
jgi:hypothetical protein